jgi:hypothetical protein
MVNVAAIQAADKINTAMNEYAKDHIMVKQLTK